MKILAPSGNMESLKMAIYNGADEVYLGINSFNARNNIDGFTIQTLKDAVDFAHLFEVKVFLAINILFSDSQLQSAVDTIISAYNLGVDAFIIQDLGLAHVISKNYPQIVLHASTQMAIHNLEGVKQLEKYNFKRVVLARETPLSEIKRIKENSDIEIEYFVQGALCVSFSGNCYLSSYLFNASGNRGKCKQLCRLPYTLRLDNKPLKKGYLLSAKDFDMTKRLGDLESAGVTSIKIEGRARRPFYVAMATRQYFNALNGKQVNRKHLELAFNRNYTEGYFNGNDKIISNIQSHIGIEIGRVEKVNYGKNFNQIYILSNTPISKKSVLKFFDGDKEESVLTAYDVKQLSNSTYLVTTTQKVKQGQTVRLILDAQLEEQTLARSLRKKIEVRLSVRKNQNLLANVVVKKDNQTVGKSITGEFLQPAKNIPLEEQDFLTCFSKSDIFEASVTFSHFEKVFIPKSQLNEFRREVFKVVFDLLTLNEKEQLKPIHLQIPKVNARRVDFFFTEHTQFNTEKEVVIYSPEEYTLQKVLEFSENCKKNGKKGYLDLPNFALSEDAILLYEIVKKSNVGVVVNNYYALGFTDDMLIGGGLNVYNSVSASVFDKPILCAESLDFNKVDMPYMTLRHCPMKEHLSSTCKNCKYKDGYEYVLDKTVMKLKRKKLSTCTFYLIK